MNNLNLRCTTLWLLAACCLNEGRYRSASRDLQCGVTRDVLALHRRMVDAVFRRVPAIPTPYFHVLAGASLAA